MPKPILALMTAATLAATSPLLAQQHQHATADTQSRDMAAMMCGGGMSAMMHDMNMPGMKQGMRTDSTKQGMARMAMPNMMQMMGPPSPAIILMQKQKLGLSAAQITRLEELQKPAQAECVRHMQLAMTSHHAALPMLEAAAPDFTAFTAKVKEAAGHMVEGHVAMAKAAVAAREVLTAEQRETLKGQMEKMHKKP